MDFKHKYLKYKKKYLDLKGGTRFQDDPKCDTPDKTLSNFTACLDVSKIDAVNSDFVFIDSTFTGTSTFFSYLFYFIYDLFYNFNVSSNSIYFYIHAHGLYECLKKINTNIRDRTQISINDIKKLTENKDFELVLEKFTSSYCTFDNAPASDGDLPRENVFLKILQESLKLKHSVIINNLTPINKVNIKSSFESFFLNIKDSGKNNMILNIAGHGGTNEFYISANPPVSIDSDYFYNQLLYLNLNTNLKNLIICANHCQAETFYNPLFRKIVTEEKLNFNVIILKAQINLMESHFFNWQNTVKNTAIATAPGIYGGISYNNLRYTSPSGNSFLIHTLPALVTHDKFDVIDAPSNDDTCGDASAGGIVDIMQMFYNQTNIINLNDIKQMIFDKYIADRRGWSGIIDNIYDNNFNDEIKNQIKDQLVKVYLNNPTNLNQNNINELLWS